jgi:hypothetical protein
VIAIGAAPPTRFPALSGVPDVLAVGVAGAGRRRIGGVFGGEPSVILDFSVLYFVLAMFLDPIATTTLFRGAAWFAATDLATVAPLIAFPDLSLAASSDMDTRPSPRFAAVSIAL